MLSNGADASSPSTGDAGGSGANTFQRDSDMRSMRDLLIDERKKRENQSKDN